MRTAARWISVLLHPVFMPLYVLALALWVDPHMAYFLPDQAKLIVLLMVMVMTVIFPLTSTLLLLKARMISSLEMPGREERITPYAMTILYYGMTYYLLRQSPLHPVVLSIFAGIIVSMILTTLATIKWKVSIHMVGIGGMLGAITGIAMVHSIPLMPVIAGIILLAGLLGTARLLSGNHEPSHIYGGFAIGCLATWTCVFFGIVV